VGNIFQVGGDILKDMPLINDSGFTIQDTELERIE